MRPIRLRLALVLLFLLSLGVGLWAQQTWTVSVPTANGNTAQWGSTSVTTATALSDALGNPTSPLIGANALLWDAAAWVRHKATSLTNMPASTTLTARNAVGAALVEKSGRWSVIHNPAASSQATASIAAEATVRHVVDCVSFSAGATTAPALTALTVNLRDGATGAGTIIWTYEVIAAAATGQSVAPHTICGLSLVGTTNTATTLEFSAGLTNLIEAVSISGYNVN